MTLKSLPVRKLLLGKPVLLIKNGKILENNMLIVKNIIKGNADCEENS